MSGRKQLCAANVLCIAYARTAQERAHDVPHTTIWDQKVAHVQRTWNTRQTRANKGQETRGRLGHTAGRQTPCARHFVRYCRQTTLAVTKLSSLWLYMHCFGSKLAKIWSPRPIVSLSKSKEKIDHVPQLVQVAPKAHIVHCSVPADNELNKWLL